MSNLHFNIFEDNKENSRSQQALVNKTKEIKLKTISGNENQEVKHRNIFFVGFSTNNLMKLNPDDQNLNQRKALTTEEFLKDKKANLLQPSAAGNQKNIFVDEKPANPADIGSSSCTTENTANEDLETTT